MVTMNIVAGYRRNFDLLKNVNEFIGQQVDNTNLRFVVVVNTYKMFYRIESKQNTVVSVWDGRRNPDGLKVE